MNRTKWRSCWVLVFCMACGEIGCTRGPTGPAESGGPQPPAAAGPSAKTTVESTTKAAPDLSVASVAYAEEYKKDQKAHETKYKNKTIELTGAVTDVGRTLTEDSFLLLEGAKGELLGVQCVTKDKEPWKKAMPGQTVTIRGIRPLFAMGAALSDCEIGDVTGPKPPTIGADELAKSVKSDRDGTEKKYDSKYLILTGEIDKVDLNEMGAATVDLKLTEPKPAKVACSFDAFQKKSTQGLKPGQKTTLLGQFGFVTGDGEVTIRNCTLLESP